MPICTTCGKENPEDARFCQACAAALRAAPHPEERKVASVLFADLVGSTELGASHDPEHTRAILDRFYEAMAAEIEAAGGTVEKFAGDAVMAAFGVPVAQEDHAERALHAALSMQRRLEELFGEALELRIGVNTGEVVVGRPREGSSFVTGDAVNVAARLEQAAAAGEILVGERTAASARGAFEFDKPAVVEAKGKPGGVASRRLLRALSLMRPRGIGGLGRAFVGREPELELLVDVYHRAVRDGEPELVTILGEAGLGKTRLARELWERLGDESREPLRRTGRCLPYGQSITYWPLAEVLREQLGLLESDPPETVHRRLGDQEILGLTLGLELSGGLHPLAARDRLHEAWVQFLGDIADKRPLVLLIEDIHWADDELLNLLERIVEDVRGPLLLVATTRPELLDRRPRWGARRHNAATLWLEPLSSTEATRMLDELLAGDLPPRLRDLVVARAEGNPFFVEELIATLIDQGVLARANGRWSAVELPADVEIPDSIRAVLAARIDLLPAVEKAALQAASVVGRVFWAGPIYELLEGAQPDFHLLEERDFIRRRSGSTISGEHEFAIKHALTREVAYASLPKAKRARLHAAFAAWLERVGEGRDEDAALLAHHYAEAVQSDAVELAWADTEDELERLRQQAVAWLRRAADLAVARYAPDEALQLLHRALELVPSDEEQGECWRAIGYVNALRFEGEEFWTAMLKAAQLVRGRDELAGIYAELASETAVRTGIWQRRPDSELVEGWIAQALDLAQPESSARARALAARALLHPAESSDAAAEAVAIAEQLGDATVDSLAWFALAQTAIAGDRYDEAIDSTRRRLRLVEELPDPRERCDVYWAATLAYAGAGRVDDARRSARQLDEAARPISPHHAVHGVGVRLMVEELAGSWDAARELRETTEQTVAENATRCVFNPRSLLVCALASELAGDEGEAKRFEQAADLLGMEGFGLSVDAPRLRLAIARGELGTVEQLLADATEPAYFVRLPALTARLDALAALSDRPRLEAEALPLLRPATYVEPFALRALGLVRDDEEFLAKAVARFEAMGLGWHAGETRALMAGR